jgi:hypothetical protein
VIAAAVAQLWVVARAFGGAHCQERARSVATAVGNPCYGRQGG